MTESASSDHSPPASPRVTPHPAFTFGAEAQGWDLGTFGFQASPLGGFELTTPGAVDIFGYGYGAVATGTHGAPAGQHFLDASRGVRIQAARHHAAQYPGTHHNPLFNPSVVHPRATSGHIMGGARDSHYPNSHVGSH
jgi:hypothetical protein